MSWHFALPTQRLSTFLPGESDKEAIDEPGKLLTRLILFRALNIFLITHQTRISLGPASEKETALKNIDNQSSDVIQKFKQYVAYSLASKNKYMFNVKTLTDR